MPSSMSSSSTLLNDRRKFSPPRPSGKKDARDDRDSPRRGALRELGRLDASRQGQPREEPAFGPGPVHLGRHEPLERGQHPLAPPPVERARRSSCSSIQPRRALLEQPLAQRARALVGVLLRCDQLRDDARRADAPPQPDAGEERLGGGTGLDDDVWREAQMLGGGSRPKPSSR